MKKIILLLSLAFLSPTNLSADPPCLDVESMCKGGRRLGGALDGSYAVEIPEGTCMPDGRILVRPLPAVYTHRYTNEVSGTTNCLKNNAEYFPQLYGTCQGPKGTFYLSESMCHTPDGGPALGGNMGELERFQCLPLSMRQQIYKQGQCLLAMHPDGHLGNVMARVYNKPGGCGQVDVRMVDPWPGNVCTSLQIAQKYRMAYPNILGALNPYTHSQCMAVQLGVPIEPPVTVLYHLGRGYGMAQDGGHGGIGNWGGGGSTASGCGGGGGGGSALPTCGPPTRTKPKTQCFSAGRAFRSSGLAGYGCNTLINKLTPAIIGEEAAAAQAAEYECMTDTARALMDMSTTGVDCEGNPVSFWERVMAGFGACAMAESGFQ